MPVQVPAPLFWMLGVTFLLVAAVLLFRLAQTARRAGEHTGTAPGGLAAALTTPALLVSLDLGLVWGVVQVMVCVMVAVAHVVDDRAQGRWEAMQVEVGRRSPLQADARLSPDWSDRPPHRS